MKTRFHSIVFFTTILMMWSCQPTPEEGGETSQLTSQEKMLARADSLELDTPYETPPGDTLSLHASGFAKILCSAVFITGLDFDFAAENIGYFTAPYAIRTYLSDRVLDMENKAVHITLPDGVVRTAKYVGDQGCICLPEGEEKLYFEPVIIKSSLPDQETQPWPMGDILPEENNPEGIDPERVKMALDTAFRNPEAMTAAYVVVYKGQLIGERYREGIDKYTPLESWSMGKSLTATLLGILIQQGIYELDQPAPVPEWQETPGDPRAEIRIADLLHMTSGLRFRAPQDPDFDPSLGYADHIYVYTGAVNSFQWAATRPLQWPPKCSRPIP
jgi:hypothetical protein